MRFFVILAFATTSCQFVPGTNAHSITEAERAIDANLNDPLSAQHRNSRVVADGSFVCGEVNGKNKYGGYAGFSLFAYATKSKQVSFFPSEFAGQEEARAAIAFPKPCLNAAAADIVKSLEKVEHDNEKAADEMEAQADRLDKMADEISKGAERDLH